MPRYAAEVVHQSTRPQDDDRFELTGPFEAVDGLACARDIGNIAANRRFGEGGLCTLVSATPLPLRFRAFIGEMNDYRDKRVIRGVTISIRLRLVE